MADSKRRRFVGAIIVLIGAVLLIAAVFIPWYTWQQKASEDGASITGTISTYPGLPGQNGTVQTSYSCSNLPSSVSCPSGTSNSYSNLNLNNTGQVAETGLVLLIVGFVLGLIGAILGFLSGGSGRRAGLAMALAAIAMILAIVAVGLFAAELPTAIGKDATGHTGSGPWSSFWGSGNLSYMGIPGSTATWGPGIGWYLTIGAFVVLLIGTVVLMRARKDDVMAPAAPAAPSAPAAPPPPTS